jgi:hypothetical protein
MRIITLLVMALLLPACAHAKIPGVSLVKNLFGIEKAQVAEKVTGIEKAKIADEADSALQANVGAYNTSSKTSAEAGRDITNDPEVMKEYIATVKQLNERQIRLMLQIIITLGAAIVAIAGIFAGFVTSLIAALVWALKSSMRAGIDEDKFKEKLIEREAK